MKLEFAVFGYVVRITVDPQNWQHTMKRAIERDMLNKTNKSKIEHIKSMRNLSYLAPREHPEMSDGRLSLGFCKRWVEETWPEL